jgi:ATP/maltotriose-dependent transcriptional regulator MalT
MIGAIIGGMTSRVSSPVLIGRSLELDRLETALRMARERSGGAILIAGEAGVGKTRLVTEFTRIAEDAGALVLLGGCLVLGDGALPYAPIAEALRGLARRTDPTQLDALLGPSRTELARLVPDLGDSMSGDVTAMSVDWGQARLFELLLAVLERLASTGPVVLVVEDLHWSDQSTRDLVGFLVRNLRDSQVMLVLTYRSDELHRRHPLLPFLAELGRSGRVDRLELQPFDRRESAEQLRAIAGRDLDLALIDSIHVRSGGNAFFAEELLVAAGEDGTTELPPTLRDVLMGRIADLAEPTQEFLRIASAAGQRVDPELLADASAIDEAALYEALREAVGRQVLVPDPTAGAERYAFRHSLLQEAIYDDLLPGERTRLHSAFARTLETCPAAMPSHAAELAYHWEAANDLPRALEWTVAAGLEAEAAYAFPEAVIHYERAVALWDQVPDAEVRAGRTRVEILAILAGVARFHEPARAVAHIQTAIRLVDERDDPVHNGLLHERLGRYAWIAGQGELANHAYQTAMRLIPAEPPSDARARALAGLAQILTLGARYAEARILAEEALAIARAVGARDIEGHARNTRGMDRGMAGDVEGGLEDLRAALEIADEVGIVDDIGRAHANIAWLLDVSGRLEEAVRAAETGIVVSERLGLIRFFGAHLLCGQADYLFRLGRWDDAERAARRAELVGSIGINAILEQELLARLAVARGRFEEAADRLRPLASLAERAADIQFVNPVQASLAELALWQGRPDEALDRLVAAVAMMSFTPEVRIGELYALGLRAAADAADLAVMHRSGDAEQRARDAGEDLLSGIRHRHAEVIEARPAFTAASEAWLLLCEAEASRLRREPDPDAWVRSAEAWQRLGLPYAVAYARWREAEARLAARGERRRVASSLRETLGIARRLGAEPMAREVTSLATRARVPIDTDDGAGEPVVADAPASPDPAAELGLTAREREVLALLALGRTNRQIAEELFISQNTAGVHVSNILGKLGVTSRGEAAAVAYRLGLAEHVHDGGG